MSQLSALDSPAAAESNDETGAYDAAAPLVKLSDEVVELIASIDSLAGPYTQAETARASKDEIQAAYQYQIGMLDRLEDLAKVLTSRPAVSESEIAAKVRALDALTSVDAWDRDSLRMLRRSIWKDCERFARARHAPSSIGLFRQGWFIKRFRGYSRILR